MTITRTESKQQSLGLLCGQGPRPGGQRLLRGTDTPCLHVICEITLINVEFPRRLAETVCEIQALANVSELALDTRFVCSELETTNTLLFVDVHPSLCEPDADQRQPIMGSGSAKVKRSNCKVKIWRRHRCRRLKPDTLAHHVACGYEFVLLAIALLDPHPVVQRGAQRHTLRLHLVHVSLVVEGHALERVHVLHLARVAI